MKTKVKIILVTIIALLMIVFGLVIAINQKKESIKYFSNSGYIIGNVYSQNENNIQTLYFNEGAAYKKYSDDHLQIADSDGNNVVISKENFVHYSDGSIMALKDGVAINLDSIDSKLLSYYNIFYGATLYKSNESYEIKNINETIVFDKLMFKISDNKYLIAANNIIVCFSDDQTIDFKNYIEIEYVDENIIKIFNDESNYQTIASDLYVLIDNIKIDLEYKTIEKNNVQYLTMANLVINSNDNIEILPEKEQDIIVDENQSNEGSNSTGNNTQNPTNGDNTQSNIDSSILDGITNIDKNDNVTSEEESVVQPKFTVESLDVTMIGFENLIITMEDESGIIYGNSVVQIIQNSTGKVVSELALWEEGTTTYTVNSYSNLKPDTEYTLTVSGQYEIDGTIYDRVYVSKIFRTLDIGLEIIGDCATSESLSFAIYKMDYSDIESITYDILDSNNVSVLSAEKKLSYSTENYVIASVGGLNSNSKYTIVVKNIQYGSDIVSTDNVSALQMTYEMKTLKQRPDVDVELNVSYNVLKNQLVLSIENINDINGGIKSYTYKVYINDGTTNAAPVYTVVKDNSSELALNIDDFGLGDYGQGASYYFNVELEFDDNEKTIIYSTQYSDPVSTSEIVYPQIVEYVSRENVNCETLDGILNIDDKEAFIKTNNINEYKVVLREKSNALSNNQIYDEYITIEGSVNDEYIGLPVKFVGLKPNTEYIMYTYLMSETKSIYIGYITVKTTETDPLYLKMNNNTESITSNLFEFNVNLHIEHYYESAEDGSQIANSYYDYIKENLSYITLNLYGCNNNLCTVLSDFERSISNSNNSQDLNNLLKGLNLNIYSKEFGFLAENYKAHYDTYKVYVTAYSNSNYEIPIYINDEKTQFFELNIIDNRPMVSVKVSEIGNIDYKKDTLLDDDTTVGFKLELTETNSTKGIGINEFKYEIYEGECSQIGDYITGGTQNLGNNLSSNDHFIDIYFDETEIKRGINYCLRYSSNYEDENGELQNTSSDTIDIVAQKQSAKIIGYLSKYDGSLITFKLKVVDIDSEMQRLYLRDDNQEYALLEILEECKNIYCDYDFEVSNLSKTFSLFADFQKTNVTDVETQKIYNFTLDNVKSIGNPNLNVIDKNGKLNFILNDLGVDVFGLKFSYKNSNNENVIKYLNFNVEVESNPDDGNSGNLENSNLGTTKYVATISNSELKDYGITKGTTDINFENVTVELIYSDGSIDAVNSNLFGIKQANLNLNESLYYYNTYLSNSFFENKTSLNSIYFDYYDDEKETTITKNVLIDTELKLNDLTYVSSDSYNTTMGQSIASTLIHKYKVLFKEFNLSAIKVPIDTVLLTSNTITHTTTGANMDFEIVDTDIFNNLKTVKFELDCNGSVENVEWAWDSNSNSWSYPSGSAHIEALDKKDNNLISVKLTGIEQCKYSLSYTKNTEETNVSINAETNQKNEGIITPLKSLVVDNLSMKYGTSYWNLNGDESDLYFEKNLTYKFDVIQNYELNENETLYYDVIISNGESVNVNVATKIISNSENSEIVYLYSYIPNSIPSGTYTVTIKPYVDAGQIRYDLSQFNFNNNLVIENNAPNFSAVSYQDVIHLDVNDKYGIFAEWKDDSNLTGINLDDELSLQPNIINNKKYYFELLSEGNVVAYKALSFITKTSEISLKDVMGPGKLGNGTYGARICYYSIVSTEKQCTNVSQISLVSSNTLSASVMRLSRSYLLDFDNPDESAKDSIAKIEYTMLYINGTTSTKTLSNFEFIQRTNSDGSSSYFTELPIDTSTANVGSLEVKLYDSNGREITKILYTNS